MENTELTFTFTIQEANTLLMALQEIPAKVANPLTAKIQQQAQPQLPNLIGAVCIQYHVCLPPHRQRSRPHQPHH